VTQTPLPIEQHDSTPTVPLADIQKVRLGELAKQLETARTQGYIEANVLVKLLDLVKELLPLFIPL
jgi:hypothetical protein